MPIALQNDVGLKGKTSACLEVLHLPKGEGVSRVIPAFAGVKFPSFKIR
jgi:hypothetical protein